MKRIQIVRIAFLLLGTQFSTLPFSTCQNESPVQLSGALNFDLQAYESRNLDPRRKDLTWRISGNPVIAIGEFSIPLKILTGNLRSPLRQSFDRVGLTPQYKWAKAHIGYSTVHFSPLVLSRNYFLGGGIELNPSLFRFGFIYGKFRRAVEQDQTGLSTPSFSRKGYAMKIGIGSTDNFVDLIFLKAADELASIDFETQPKGIRPGENVALGISSQQRFFKDLYLEVHGGMSLYNRDLRSANSDSLEFPGKDLLKPFITLRNSSQLLFALQSKLEYRKDAFQIGLGYDRISPDYRTMGLFYLQDDVERLTVISKWRMIGNKMNVHIRLGAERNNLKENRYMNYLRTVGALNLNYQIANGVSLFANYSNFIQNAELENIGFSDTLVLEQVLNNAGAGLFIFLNRNKFSHQINLNGNYFLSSLNHPGQSGQNARFLNLIMLYNLNLPKAGWGFQLGGDFMTLLSGTQDQLRIGPQVGISKYFMERKLFTDLRSSIFLDNRNDALFQTIFRHSFSLNLRVYQKHAFRIRAYYLHTTFANALSAPWDEVQLDSGFRFGF